MLRANTTVIRQKNQGPGPARNTGLSSLDDAITWIAFLDSDDIWSSCHLRAAIAGLEAGYDFFFADGAGHGTEAGWFRAIGFQPVLHTPGPGQESLLAFAGDFLDIALRQAPCPTSTVVMRRSVLGALRFPAIRGICEDLQFWVEVAMHAPRVTFSNRIHVAAGEGLHVSLNADWRSNAALRNQCSYSRYYRWVLRSVPLATAQRQRILARLRATQIDFATTALAMAKARVRIDPALLWNFTRRNPFALVEAAGILARRAIHPQNRPPSPDQL